MDRFTLPRDIYFGRGSVSHIEKLKGKKAILVLGCNSMRQFGFVDKIIKHLDKVGIKHRLIEHVEPNPSIETAEKGAEIMRDFGPDWIIAMGGGSVMDAAKAMWIFYEYPSSRFEDIIKPFSLPTLRTKARFIAIPSTSGTASEVTAFCVITHDENKIKYTLADYQFTPDIAILDPDLVDNMSPKLVAYTGMIALTHAIEAYVSKKSSLLSDPMALEAVSVIMHRLFASYQIDLNARESIHYAQCLAGMAFTNTLLGIVHSMAHKTGTIFDIPQGCTAAIYLPYVIQFNEKVCQERYATLAKASGLQGHNNEELTYALWHKIQDMNKSMDIPLTLKAYGIDEHMFYEKLPLISARALDDTCTSANPRNIDLKQMEKLFICIYHGQPVDF